MTVMYNGIQFAPVSVKQSIVVPCPAEVLWSVVGRYGKGALWMGSVAGQPIFSQLLVRFKLLLRFKSVTAVAGKCSMYKQHLSEC